MRVMVLLVTAASLACAPRSWAGAAADTFERLKLLAGDWEADLPGFGKLTSTIRVVSNGKAIEETIGTPTDNELSVYTLDRDRVMLTHFCALTPDGHVVRLLTSRLSDGPGRLDFVLSSASNLHTPTAAHMHRMRMALGDHDHFAEKWTKTERGKATVFDLSFVRR